MKDVLEKEVAPSGIPSFLDDDISADSFDLLEAEAAAAPTPIPIPTPILLGTKFMIWKQDPSVASLGRRLLYMPRYIFNGPRDARIDTKLPGTTPVVRSGSGFIFPANSEESDCAHTFAVVRETLTMYERLQGGTPIPWVWNTGGNTDMIDVYPRGFNGANAFYSRNAKSLKFGYFVPSGWTSNVYTCRSLDIVSHETGHAILDGIKPGWLGWGNPPQTGGLHESFGDLTAIFLALSQLDQVESVIALTGANLHVKSFIKRLAEQFGLTLGQQMGLRNADNDLKLSQVSNEVHAISQVFTGGVYDVLADIFNYEKYRQRATKGPAHVLLDVAQNVAGILFKALKNAPDVGATYSHVVNEMLKVTQAQGDPAIYRTFIRNRFTYRQVVVSPTPLTAMAEGRIDFDDDNFIDGEDIFDLKEAIPNHPSLVAHQDRSHCCGTMQNPEYMQDEKALSANLKHLRRPGETLSEEVLLSEETAGLKVQFK